MKAIIFYNYVNRVHGGVIDFIEYFLCSLKYNKDVKLIIINNNDIFMNIINNLISEKYNIPTIEYKKNILSLHLYDIFRIKFDKALLIDYGTIAKLKGFISLKYPDSKIIILSDLHTDDSNYVITKSIYPKNSVLYYGEMPYVYKDFEYKHKFFFDHYKTINNQDEAIFLHVPESDDYSFISNYPEIFKGKQIVYKTHEPKKNLFSLFDTFVYYHADKWFDPRPRLMHECYFYDKTIHYINVPNCKDGSYYRYKDLMKNGIDNRFLNREDEIIQHFI